MSDELYDTIIKAYGPLYHTPTAAGVQTAVDATCGALATYPPHIAAQILEKARARISAEDIAKSLASQERFQQHAAEDAAKRQKFLADHDAKQEQDEA
jgi:hypothetical protein